MDGPQMDNYWRAAADLVSKNADLTVQNAKLTEALRKALNFLENTESELGVTLDSAEVARTALSNSERTDK